MSYDDDPPEPTEEETQQAQAAEAVRNNPVRIEGLTVAAIEHTIRGIVESNWRISERVDQAIDEAVAERVAKLVDETTKERIEKAVDAAIADGFATFDSYSGRKTGSTSVGELVHKLLATRVERGYDEKGTIAEIAVQRAVKQLFDGAMKNVVAAVVADFKKQADEVFKAKLVAGMREALGLR